MLSQARYVLITRLVMPLSAALLLILIGHRSSTLLGEYALVTTLFFVMQTLPLLGLTPYVMRQVARAPATAGDYFITIGLVALACCVPVALSTHWIVTFAPYPAVVKAAVDMAGYAIVPGILAFLAEVILISINRSKSVAMVAVVENALRLAGSAWLVYRGTDVETLIEVLVVTRSFAFLAYLMVLSRAGITLLKRPSVALLKDASHVLPTFLLTTVLALIVSRFDYVILSIYESAEGLAYYAIAYRLYEIAILGTTALVTALFPVLARRYSSNRAVFADTIKHVFLLVFILATGLAIVGFGFAESYVLLLFPKQYPQPVIFAQLFILILAISGLDILLSSALLAGDRQSDDLRALACGGAVYALALIVSVPSMGILGAFVSLVLATLAQMLYRLRAFKTAFGVSMDRDRLAATAICGVLLFAAAAWLTRISALWSGPAVLLLAMTLFPLCVVVFGGFRLSAFLAKVWWPAKVRPLDSVLGVFDHIAEDARARRKLLAIDDAAGATPHYDNFGELTVVLFRWSKYFHLTGNRFAVRLLRNLNMMIAKADIATTAEVGPGLVLPHPAVAMLSGKVGRHAVFGPLTGLGLSGTRDVGAGPGVPVVGDNVSFRARAAILGAIYVEDGSALPANSLISTARDLKRCLER